MEFEKTPLPGLYLIKPKIYEDSRGYFFESFNEKIFSEEGINISFVQDNQSCSTKGVLRGLHFQKKPHEQGKLVRVVHGSVLDVAVDMRKDSPAFGQHYKQILSSKNNLMMWIPPGFAHGFLALESDTVFTYKCSAYYNKDAEAGVIWNDKDLKIDWQVNSPVISSKDEALPTWKEYWS